MNIRVPDEIYEYIKRHARDNKTTLSASVAALMAVVMDEHPNTDDTRGTRLEKIVKEFADGRVTKFWAHKDEFPRLIDYFDKVGVDVVYSKRDDNYQFKRFSYPPEVEHTLDKIGKHGARAAVWFKLFPSVPYYLPGTDWAYDEIENVIQRATGKNLNADARQDKSGHWSLELKLR